MLSMIVPTSGTKRWYWQEYNDNNDWEGNKNVKNNSDKNSHNSNDAITKIILITMVHNDINTSSLTK